ncbi:putative quinol monooxygenase [Reinekea sp.]|uniref:putative quinol monooxygenase n=1 Tax=Reinekea sp. TaxID=1970455 RepID=UPI002A8096C2|nr:putative quinol monooxygenase [Reinekea sp.]
MTQLTIVVNIYANPDRIALVQAELEKLVPITLSEAGCVRYELHQNNVEPAHFIFYETWATRELWQAHLAQPHVAAYARATEGAVNDFKLHELTSIS